MCKNFLIIETSGNDSFVAVHLSNGELVSEFLPPYQQSQTLLPAIKRVLNNRKIEFIAIGVGPGSFTGTRIGVLAAKALGFARALPLLPFCSLQRFIPEVDGSFTIAIDAKARGFYTLKGYKKGKVFSFEEPCFQKTIPKKVQSILNLPALAFFLLKKFAKEYGLFHHEIQVSYLYTP